LRHPKNTPQKAFKAVKRSQESSHQANLSNTTVESRSSIRRSFSFKDRETNGISKQTSAKTMPLKKTFSYTISCDETSDMEARSKKKFMALGCRGPTFLSITSQVPAPATKRGLVPLRSRKLHELMATTDNDFGDFKYKNLPVLEKAGRDTAQRLKEAKAAREAQEEAKFDRLEQILIAQQEARTKRDEKQRRARFSDLSRTMRASRAPGQRKTTPAHELSPAARMTEFTA
jgi:hypothetical protein